MPEMPEVQGLTSFLEGRAVGRTIVRTSVGAIAALGSACTAAPAGDAASAEEAPPSPHAPAVAP
jgi:hypothetical protein